MTTPSFGGPLISFEIMPPRKPEIAPKFWTTTADLLSYSPDFVSVTYGTGGKDKRSSLEVIARLVREAHTQPIAHFTCIGTDRTSVSETVRQYLRLGVRTFLALRGDSPANQPDWKPAPNGIQSASELVATIRAVEAQECCHYPSSRLRQALRPLTIAVATFPNGNPAAGTTPAQEAERLVLKQAAGADFAISQLFWRADDYLHFCELARSAGVTIPIVPGILPATDPYRINRVSELTGIKPPEELLDIFRNASDTQQAHQRGCQFGARLACEVLQGGAPGLHLYTFNKSQPALELLATAAEISGYPLLNRITPTLHTPINQTAQSEQEDNHCQTQLDQRRDRHATSAEN